MAARRIRIVFLTVHVESLFPRNFARTGDAASRRKLPRAKRSKKKERKLPKSQENSGEERRIYMLPEYQEG